MTNKKGRHGADLSFLAGVQYSKPLPKTRDLAAGHWLTIYSQALAASETVFTHARHQPCPCCGGADRFRFFPDWGQTGAYICSQCGSGDGFDLLMKVAGQGYGQVCKLVERILGFDGSTGIDLTALKALQEVAEEQRQQQRERIEREAPTRLARLESTLAGATLLADADENHPVLKYLRRRGLSAVLEASELPELWCHNALPYRFDEAGTLRQGTAPAVLAAVTDLDGNLITVHRTWLSKAGQKHPMPDPKKLMPATMPGASKGAAAKLYAAGAKLAVCEGLETALAIRAMLPDLPVWAAMTATGLEHLRLPENVREVFVMADFDASGTGQRAGQALCRRLTSEGRTAHFCLPPVSLPDGTKSVDWLDWYVAADGAA